ncbi:MAG: hypothetical protein HY711_04830, partial [Candidatus Melainabacteria bacterium]|nr:hypothetical protein [Candidatus Melainabacteria bacterium]
MVLEMQDLATVETTEVWVSEFGLFDLRYLESDKKYQGRVYRLPPESVKSISEAVGFTARFDSPNIRVAYLDVMKTEGRVVFEIERNTSPSELASRYSKERWSSVENAVKGPAPLCPWVRTNYVASFLPEKVLVGFAGELKLKPDQREHFYVRVNFKDRTMGFIAEDKYVDEFPAGAFQVFALPAGHIPIIASLEMMSQTQGASREAEVPAKAVAETGTKYATYSRSEIDRMLKQSADSITSALSAKITGQQRLFQESVAAQERSFAKLTDKLACQLEETRSKWEANMKAAQIASKSELTEFKSQLSKELEQFRAHVNKNIIPLSKALDEKIQSIEQLSKSPTKEPLKPLLIG